MFKSSVFLRVVLSSLITYCWLVDVSAFAQVLVADYQFQNTLASSVGTAPDLINLGSNTFVTETVDAEARTVLFFPEGSGLALSPTTGLIPSDTYSIVVLFRFENVTSWRRIVDFKNASSDTGLYNYWGDLNFYPVALGSEAPIIPDTYVQVVLTRDPAKNVVGYVNGVQQFSFEDTSDLAVIDGNNILRFFKDDGEVSNEHSAGAVARIRLYDGALTAGQVVMLDRLPTCPLTVALEGDPQKETKLGVLYDFRDKVLASTPTGGYYIELFYKHAVEGVWLMFSYPELLSHARMLVERFLPTIQAVVAGQPAMMTYTDLVGIEALLEAFAEKGSPELRADLRAIREDLWQGVVLEQFGIVVR